MVRTPSGGGGADRALLISHHREVTVPVTPALLEIVDTLCMEFVAEWDEWAALQRAAYDTDEGSLIADPDAYLRYVEDGLLHRKEAQAFSRRMIDRFGDDIYAEALKHYGF